MYAADAGLIDETRNKRIHPTVALAINEILWLEEEADTWNANLDLIVRGLHKVLRPRHARKFLKHFRYFVDETYGNIYTPTVRMDDGISQYLVDSASTPSSCDYDLSILEDDLSIDQSAQYLDQPTTPNNYVYCIQLLDTLPFDVTGLQSQPSNNADLSTFCRRFLRRRSMCRVFYILAHPWDGWTARNKSILQKFLALGAQVEIRDDVMAGPPQQPISTPPSPPPSP